MVDRARALAPDRGRVRAQEVHHPAARVAERAQPQPLGAVRGPLVPGLFIAHHVAQEPRRWGSGVVEPQRHGVEAVVGRGARRRPCCPPSRRRAPLRLPSISSTRSPSGSRSAIRRSPMRSAGPSKSIALLGQMRHPGVERGHGVGHGRGHARPRAARPRVHEREERQDRPRRACAVAVVEVVGVGRVEVDGCA